MKISLYSFILIYFFIWVTLTNAKDTSYYHNKEYKFRIQFPSGWQIKEGVGEHIVKKAVYNGCDVIINVTDISEIPGFLNELKKDEIVNGLSEHQILKMIESEFDSRKFSEGEFESIMTDFISTSIQEMKTRFPNLNIIENRITYIANTKFIYLNFQHQIRIMDKKVDYISLQFITIRRGKIFVIGGGAEFKDFQTMSPIIIAAINSFQFEDWDIPLTYESDESPTNKNKEDNPILMIISSGIALLLIIGFILRLIYNRKDIDERDTSNNEKFADEKPNKNPINDIPESYEVETYQEIEDSNLSDEEKARVYGDVLKLKGKITKEAITSSWKKMIEKYHPDKVSHLGEEFQKYAEKKTKDINKAYSYFKKKYAL